MAAPSARSRAAASPESSARGGPEALRGAFGGTWCFAITTFAGGTEAEGSPEGAPDDDTAGPATGRVVSPPKGSIDCTAAVGSSTTDPATDCTITDVAKGGTAGRTTGDAGPTGPSGPAADAKGGAAGRSTGGSGRPSPATDCAACGFTDAAKGGTAGRTIGDAGPTGPAGSPVDAVTPGPACSGPP